MSSPGESRLRFLSGPREGENFPLEGREVLIGRQEGDLILRDEEASRRHARIVPDGAGYRIEDLGFERACALSQLEAAALRYALHRGGQGNLNSADRDLVHQALRRLGQALPLPEDLLGSD